MSFRTYNFLFPSFNILNLRSGTLAGKTSSDTDYVSFGLQVIGQTPQVLTRFVGDQKGGTVPVGLSFNNVTVADSGDVVILTYLIVNSSQGQDKTIPLLGNAVTKLLSLAEKADEAAISKEFGIDLGSLTPTEAGILLGAQIGTGAVPVIGSALGALAAWLASIAPWSALAPNCDGQVAQGIHVFSGASLRALLPAGTVSFADDNPGLDSPGGCGSNSHYVVNWSITLVADLEDGHELCVARNPNHMDLFWVHPGGSINSTWWDAGVAGGSWLPARVFTATAAGKAVGGPVTVVARTPNHMDLFWVHPDGSINSTWWDAGVAGGAWDPNRVFAATAPGMARPGNAVAVVARTPNHMDLFWVHPDGSIYSTWWDAGVAGGAWEINRVLAATPPAQATPGGAVAVVARTPNHVDLFWVHPDGSINSTWWDANVTGGAWEVNRVFAATAPSQATPGSPVAVVARTPNHMDLFWVHPDGSIYSTWWDVGVTSGAWDPNRVFATTAPGKAKPGSAVAVLARTPTHMDLFWVHPDGSINSTWWDANVAGGVWDPNRVFAVTGTGASVS